MKQARLMKPIALAVLNLLLAGSLAAEVAVPPLTGRVVDLTGVLKPSEVQDLTSRIEALEKEKGSQIAVLILPTTGEETIEQFSIRVAESWKIGRKGIDDGVLLILARDDRKLRIEVGYGLEGALTDAATNRIIQEQMVPHLKQSEYGQAVSAGVAAIILVIRGEPLPPPAAQAATDLTDPDWKTMLFLLGFGGIFWIVGSLVPLSVHRFAALFAFFVGAAAFLFTWIWGAAPWPLAYIAGGAGAFVAGILVTVFGSASGSTSGSGSTSSSGSSSSGWRSSGGFSGGGGRFGGGGSSGSW